MSTASLQSDDRPTGDALSLPALKDGASRAILVMGHALDIAQQGKRHQDAKPLSGFGDAGVLEIIEDHTGDTYRVVYTVRFSSAVYALHAFQKKSKKGVQTPKKDIELIKSRLKKAEEHYTEWSQ